MAIPSNSKQFQASRIKEWRTFYGKYFISFTVMSAENMQNRLYWQIFKETIIGKPNETHIQSFLTSVLCYSYFVEDIAFLPEKDQYCIGCLKTFRVSSFLIGFVKRIQVLRLLMMTIIIIISVVNVIATKKAASTALTKDESHLFNSYNFSTLFEWQRQLFLLDNNRKRILLIHPPHLSLVDNHSAPMARLGLRRHKIRQHEESVGLHHITTLLAVWVENLTLHYTGNVNCIKMHIVFSLNDVHFFPRLVARDLSLCCRLIAD